MHGYIGALTIIRMKKYTFVCLYYYNYVICVFVCVSVCA